MFDSVVLDIAIGLIFVFLATSLAITAGIELHASLLKWRAKDLATGLRSLVGDSGAAKLSGPDITRAIYQHPVIRGLHSGAVTSDRNAPSFIPPRLFAMALLDIALKPTDEAQQLASASITELRVVVEARRGELGKQVTEALLTFIHHAEADTRTALSNLEKLQANVESWFDAGMDRVSSIYRRRAQLSSTILALFFVAALNLDAIRITRALANDPVLRATLIAQATVVVKADAAAAAQPAPPAIEEAPKSAPSATADALRQLQSDVSTINQLGIPIGWDDNPPRDNFWWWLNKVLGLLLTGLAASLGAPFWFDILKKVTALRSAGRPPAPPPTDKQ